jgi:hypothetical protein
MVFFALLKGMNNMNKNKEKAFAANILQGACTAFVTQ